MNFLKKGNKVFFILGVMLSLALVGGLAKYEKNKDSEKALQITDDIVGEGPSASPGQVVTIDYQAYVYDESEALGRGQIFDSTYARHEAISFEIGQGQVIPGLEKGVIGMKAGGRRNIIVPASMAYGDSGAGEGLVPPKARVLYVVELKKMNLSE